MSVVIETTIGDLTVDLFLKERPRACQNFLKLCKIKYYNFSLFHTVQRDFIAQTGDPAGTGKGGTSLYGLLYGDQARYFEAEKTPKMKHRNLGTLSFASHGDNLLGSQFFVTLSESLESLDGEHCVFGQVVEGTEVLAKLNDAICDQNFQPYQDIRITHTAVLDDPLDDPEGLEVPSRSPSPTADVLKSGRIAADEDVEETAGRSAAELDELIQQREAAARATILEMVGDLPDADVAPPENVLFVCKLNPVTTDDDLQIIFSRFGKIVSCEIIRDNKTNNSLQYGFIEFDNPRSCENAYFKMDNVLIDDRRIHVDFSQSVSRVQWKGKGRITFQKGTDAKDMGNYTGQGGRSGDRGRGRGRGGQPAPPARDRRSERGGSIQGTDRGERERNGRERGGQHRYSEHRREERGGTDDRRHGESRTDRRRYEGRDERKREDRRREDGRSTSRPGRREDSRGAAVSERYTEGRHGREDRADEGRSRNTDRQLAGGLDVNQLKALLGNKDKTRSSSGSSDETETTSKKKKRPRRESPSDSDSSVDKTPPKKQKKSRREHSSSPEGKQVKRHNSSKKVKSSPKQDRKDTKKKRKDKNRDHKSEKRIKKKKKQRRKTSSDDSSSSSSSEENCRKRKKAKKSS